MGVNEKYFELKVKTAGFDFVTGHVFKQAFTPTISFSTCKMDFVSNDPYFMFVKNVV